ncbi:helix-turn-helix transcriptional regulator [Pseudomonas sp. RP23018S]|uniref:helix-turn-helix domain-containing protein n=1 Tax=Pseudomonas sp. RP23018S TaxID=3096037 RepID=UPI002ACA7540|nr:helix-turn-helix transcriptional regulator [Pseudomonas sp. RP23018S]MDZ5602914.1 helix-turn-helix transcriptional regulator [Pseudomonas sp. RP23018S]
MPLKTEIAATLRAIRQQRKLSYDNLGDAAFRTTLSLLERGKSGVSIGKLTELAQALEFDPVALMALCVSLQRGERFEDTLASAQAELKRFAEAGGIELLHQQMDGKNLAKRSPGKPLRIQSLLAVQALKAQGKTQAEAVRELGLSHSTVQRYWHSDHPTP